MVDEETSPFLYVFASTADPYHATVPDKKRRRHAKDEAASPQMSFPRYETLPSVAFLTACPT
jgi:hypothetical protein